MCLEIGSIKRNTWISDRHVISVAFSADNPVCVWHERKGCFSVVLPFFASSIVTTFSLFLSLSLSFSFLAHSLIFVHSLPFVALSYTQLMSTHTSVMTDRRSGMIPSLSYRQTTSTIVSRAVAAAAANNHHHSIRRGGGTGRGSKRYSVSAFYSMAAEQDVEVHDELAKGEKKGGWGASIVLFILNG